jgi:hypothetical protein
LVLKSAWKYVTDAFYVPSSSSLLSSSHINSSFSKSFSPYNLLSISSIPAWYTSMCGLISFSHTKSDEPDVPSKENYQMYVTIVIVFIILFALIVSSLILIAIYCTCKCVKGKKHLKKDYKIKIRDNDNQELI